VPSSELRAGLVLTGGGTDLDGLVDVAEQTLGVPVRKGIPHGIGGLTDVVAAPEWACAAGLLLYGRQSAATARAKSKPTRDLLSKFKSSLRALFPTSNAL
jgi:cell division protein FtsA